MALARKTGPRSGDWWERTYTIGELPEVLPAVAGEEDVYLSTQRFHGWRRISRLAEMGALAIDLDYYRVPELAGAHPLGVLGDVQTRLELAALPAPSLAIGSGRGLYLLWLHGPVPRAALPRWSACQRSLWEVLRPLGADRQALDAARVLRVVGTRHGGSGVTVEALTPAGDVWDFDRLADEILPYTRAELHDLRIQRALRRAQSPSKARRAPPQGFTQGTLWEARLGDFQRLRALRWFGAPMPDFRDRWLFLAGVSMSWLAPPEVLWRELYALAREVGGWNEGRTRSKMHAIFRTATRAAAEQKVTWQGRELDPRYHFRNQTLIDWLEITPEEERGMKTIISGDERRRRDRVRDEKRRRAAGAMTREQYEGRAQERREEAVRLRSEGLSYREIARRLEVSKSAVIAMLKASGDGGSKSLRLYGGVASPVGGSGSEGVGITDEVAKVANGGAASEGKTQNAIQSEAEVFDLARAWFGIESPGEQPPAPEQLSLNG